jgi:two-component system cell cycle response regulator DivK
MMDKDDRVLRKKRILVVDDSEDMRFLLEQLLEDDGYDVNLAADGQMAIAQAQQCNPDLILMDMSLPLLDGWEAVTYLRKQEQFLHTPIIAVTAHVSKGAQERAVAVGCNDHVSKPFDLVVLLDRIEQLVNVAP